MKYYQLIRDMSKFNLRLQMVTKAKQSSISEEVLLYGSVNRVIKQNNLIKPKKKRWRKRKDLSELKRQMNFFQMSQIDTKDLIDIYQYWPLMRRLHLPRYEYTLRELLNRCCLLCLC